MKEIEDLIKEIANYNKYVFIHKITTHYWDCVKKQSFDKDYDQFVRCATWLCYFASINDDLALVFGTHWVKQPCN